jgi:hypothetical protein
MRINLGQEPAVVERKIEHPSFGSFFISIKPLDMMGKARYWSAQAESNFPEILDIRIRSVVGWRDLLDSQDHPIPFNRENLDKVLSANDDLFGCVINAVHDAFGENRTALTEEQIKN